jgi:hypothetical protein
LEQLRQDVEMPVVQIPFAFAEEFGAAQMQEIAAAITPVLMRAPRRSQSDAWS